MQYTIVSNVRLLAEAFHDEPGRAKYQIGARYIHVAETNEKAIEECKEAVMYVRRLATFSRPVQVSAPVPGIQTDRLSLHRIGRLSDAPCSDAAGRALQGVRKGGDRRRLGVPHAHQQDGGLAIEQREHLGHNADHAEKLTGPGKGKQQPDRAASRPRPGSR